MSLATNMPCGVLVDPVAAFSQETKSVRWKHNSNNHRNHSRGQSHLTALTARPQKATQPVLLEPRQKSRPRAPCIVYRNV